jgi:hypothetical protein
MTSSSSPKTRRAILLLWLCGLAAWVPLGLDAGLRAASPSDSVGVPCLDSSTCRENNPRYACYAGCYQGSECWNSMPCGNTDDCLGAFGPGYYCPPGGGLCRWDGCGQ